MLAGCVGMQVKTLNYAPGPMQTDMALVIRDCDRVHKPSRDWFRQALEKVGRGGLGGVLIVGKRPEGAPSCLYVGM
jgi:hypothetical protein